MILIGFATFYNTVYTDSTLNDVTDDNMWYRTRRTWAALERRGWPIQRSCYVELYLVRLISTMLTRTTVSVCDNLLERHIGQIYTLCPLKWIAWHLSYQELNNCCVKEDIIIISGHILCRICTLVVVQRILNSLVKRLSIWQSEHGNTSM